MSYVPTTATTPAPETSRPIDDHQLQQLVDSLTLEQKVRLLTGADLWRVPAEPAIGLRRMVLSDGPSGIRGQSWDGSQTALNLPSATALAASWDTDLAYRYGAILAVEARRKHADVVLGPTINLHRSPLGGRHFEAYSEDPLLTSRLAAAYVRGVQDGGVGATPKHYVANDFETERFTADVVVGERALRELYLAAFEDTVVNERPWLVMSAYNSVNGTTMTENPLLAEPLCGEWGFDGVVVSDWSAVHSTEPAALARQDLVMPGPDGPWGDKLVDAVLAGRVPVAAIDEKVLRVLRLAARVGALSGFAPAVAEPPAAEDGVALARRIASAGMVLVRNTGELPWAASALRSVAVIGQYALFAQSQGGGSAMVAPAHLSSPLDGLCAALPDATVTWSLGVVAGPGIAPLPPDSLTDPVSGEPGARLVIRTADGAELASENRRSVNLARLGSPRLAGVSSVEVSTRYLPRQTGTARLGIAGAGLARMTVDGVEVLDVELVHDGEEFGGGLISPPTASATVELTDGKPVDIAVRLELPSRDRPDPPITLVVGFILAVPDRQAEDAAIAAAAAAAGRADVALVVVGTGPEVESEGFDRGTLALAGRQDDLVRAVAEANPHTVVAVNTGSPVLMPWRDEAAAVLLTWFGGQEGGHALADVLLGAAEPGGRLPTTWPAAEVDVPVLATAPVDGVVAYDEGVHIGYRAWLRSGTIPAYPFGHGLGYTTWTLAGLTVPAAVPAGARVEVTARVHNTGERAGRHVIQAYLSRPDSAIDRPARWLAGFATVDADAGTERTVTITIEPRAFQHWDGGWQLEPGDYMVHVGSSVVDLLCAGRVSVG